MDGSSSGPVSSKPPRWALLRLPCAGRRWGRGLRRACGAVVDECHCCTFSCIADGRDRGVLVPVCSGHGQYFPGAGEQPELKVSSAGYHQFECSCHGRHHPWIGRAPLGGNCPPSPSEARFVGLGKVLMSSIATYWPETTGRVWGLGSPRPFGGTTLSGVIGAFSGILGVGADLGKFPGGVSFSRSLAVDPDIVSV